MLVMKRIAVCSLLFAVVAIFRAPTVRGEPHPPRSLIIGVTPYLGSETSKRVEAALLTLVLGQVPRGTRVVVFDGYALTRVASFWVPSDPIYDDAKLRASALRDEILALHHFFAHAVGDPNLQDAIREPQFLRLIGSTVEPRGDRTLILIGSPLYRDVEEGVFSMNDGFFPSDGHLTASPDQSVFSVSGRESLLDGVRVHHCILNPSWQTDVHAQRVERFWSLYVEMQGGVLATFATDLETVTRRAIDPSSEPGMHFTYDADDAKIAMHAIRRVPFDPGWLRQATVGPSAVPRSFLGLLKVGIRWACEACDLDLYAGVGNDEVSFRRPRGSMAVHVKELGPLGRGWEYVEFAKAVDVRNVVAWVNLYSGVTPGGARGEVRVWFDGATYATPFVVPAGTGNRGARTESRRGDPHWIELPIAAILGLDTESAGTVSRVAVGNP